MYIYELNNTLQHNTTPWENRKTQKKIYSGGAIKTKKATQHAGFFECFMCTKMPRPIYATELDAILKIMTHTLGVSAIQKESTKARYTKVVETFIRIFLHNLYNKLAPSPN